MRDATLMVSVERLSGAYGWRAEVEEQTGSTANRATLRGTMVNLLFGNTATNSEEGAINVLAAPRLALDACFHGITVGGSLAYASAKGRREQSINDEPPETTHFPDGRALLLAARLGYVLTPGEKISFWLRGGATYLLLRDKEPSSEHSMHAAMLTLEPALVLVPIPHLGILVGPALDLPLGGGGETIISEERRSFGASFRSVGASVGLMGFL